MQGLTIEEIIKDQVERMDLQSMVRDEIRRMIGPKITEELHTQVRANISKIIDKEITLQMSKGVRTEDGWGKKQDFTSFEELFKKTFKERLDGSWEIKKEIERWCRDRVDAMVRANKDAVIQRMIDGLLAEKGKTKNADSDDLPI